MLEVDGQMIGESKAIERFVARLGGLMGANEVEAAQIDAMAEHVRDINTAYQKIRAMKDEEKEAAMAKWGDLEGVADVGLRMALSAKLADVVKHNRVHSTPTALPTDTDSQRRKPPRGGEVVARVPALPTHAPRMCICALSFCDDPVSLQRPTATMTYCDWDLQRPTTTTSAFDIAG